MRVGAVLVGDGGHHCPAPWPGATAIRLRPTAGWRSRVQVAPAPPKVEQLVTEHLRRRCHLDLRRIALVVSFVSGATSLGYQSLWTRLLASGSGGSSYVFSVILVFFLSGLALGALIVGLVSRRAFDAVAWLGRIQLLIAALAALGTLLRSQGSSSRIARDRPLAAGRRSQRRRPSGSLCRLPRRLAATDDAHVGSDSRGCCSG